MEKPNLFPQSANLRLKVRDSLPAYRAAGELCFFKRAKGSRLYTLDGTILEDFWLDAGRLIYGHAPSFLGQTQKIQVSLGSESGYPQRVHARLLAKISRLLPGYQIEFYAPQNGPEPGPEDLDLRAGAFLASARLIPEGDQPVRIFIKGVLGVELLATRDENFFQAQKPYWPETLLTARALGLLSRLLGPEAPWEHCQNLADFFSEQVGELVQEREGNAVRIPITPERRLALLEAGYFVDDSGWIFFSTCHGFGLLKRLAKEIRALEG